jgi:hypothetical protein
VAGLCRDASLGGQRGPVNRNLRNSGIPASNAISKTVMTTITPINTFSQIRNTAWIRIFLRAALLLAVTLLLSNLPFLSARLHAYLSALPLAMAGAAYAILQFRMRPGRRTMLKRLLLAATFMIWAVDQLLPSGRWATFIGDTVIAAYVLDLYWLIQEQTMAVDSGADSRDRSA